jgi:hypothetical protein
MRERTNGRVIRYERGAQVYFLAAKGETTTLADARVFLQDAAAQRHVARLQSVPSVKYPAAINARLDDDGRAAWVHPQWLKTEEQEKAERAEKVLNYISKGDPIEEQ